MKERVANYSLMLVVVIVSFGLFQAWRLSRNPFAFYKSKSSGIEYLTNKYVAIDSSIVHLQ